MATQTPSTLGHRANEAARGAIADYVRGQAKIVESLGEHNGPRQAAALNALAEFVLSRDRTDERLYAIWNVAAFMGKTEPYEPGLEQRGFIVRLVSEGARPVSEVGDTRNELDAASVYDSSDFAQYKYEQLHGRINEAVAKAEGAERLEERAEKAEQRASDLQGELEAERTDIRALRAQLKHLQDKEQGGSAPMPSPLGEKPKPKEQPRRVKVEGHTGIYTKDSQRDGKRFEVGYTDPVTKKQAWLTLDADTSLEEAIQTRKELSESLEVAA